MNYQESLDYIKSLVPTLSRPTMARMDLFFEELGRPQDKLLSFHVGGTNGKGSVSTYLASMIAACGKKVAKFTGPHMLKYNERLVINGRDISDEDFAAVATEVLQLSRAFAERHPQLGPLTWFEFLTAMAVQYFNAEKVDFAVFEVGLGGRFDATNVLHNVVVSTITNVDLDHMQFLGNTVAAIAGEKSGIIKKAPLVTAAGGDALKVLIEASANAGVPAVIVKSGDDLLKEDSFRDFSVYTANASAEFAAMVQERVQLLRTNLPVETLSLSAAYQRLNALTALVTISLSDLFASQVEADSDRLFAALRHGIEGSYWPGRFEIIPSRSQIMDGAHNPHGARALRQSLDELYQAKPIVFIFASFENKDARGFLKELLRPGDFLIAPTLVGERPFHKFDDIEAICRELHVACYQAVDFASAAEKAGKMIADNPGKFAEMTVITGSFATVREAKAALT